MRVVPRRKKDRGGGQSAAPAGPASGAPATGPVGPAGGAPAAPADPSRKPSAPPSPTGSPPSAGSPSPPGSPPSSVGGRTSESSATKTLDPAEWTSDETVRRRVRSSERQRMAGEIKRSRAGLRGGRRQAARDRRSSLLIMVMLLGLLIATVVVSGALVAASMETRPITLAAPLHIFPVSRTVPGQCPAGTAGISGQANTGPACYQLSRGIAISRVADLGVQRSEAGRYEVAITLRNSDREAFATLTRRTLGRDLAFVVRNRLVTVPRVDTPILDGKIVITGPRTKAEADALVRSLRGR
jgi:hypothetical protein